MTTEERQIIWDTLPDHVREGLKDAADVDERDLTDHGDPPLTHPLTDFVLKIVRELAALPAPDELTRVHAQHSDLIPAGHIIIGTGPAQEGTGGDRD